MGQRRYLELDRSTQLPLSPGCSVKNKKLEHRVLHHLMHRLGYKKRTEIALEIVQ